MYNLKILAAVFVFAVCAVTARSEIMVGETLESLADTCSDIGIFSSAAVSWELAEKNWISYAPISGRLDRTLRGKLPGTLTFQFPVWRSMNGITEMYAHDGDKFLIFAREDEQGVPHTVQIINLSHPSNRMSDLYVALRPDFTILVDPAKITAVTEDRIRSHPARPRRYGDYSHVESTVGVPMDSDAWGSLYGGSSCFLIVPPDLLYIAKKHSHE